VAKTRNTRRIRPGGFNVTRMEFENLESAVAANRIKLEKLDLKCDAILRDLAELKRRLRAAS